MSCGECSLSTITAIQTFVSSESALLFLERHGCLLPKDGQLCPQCGKLLSFFEKKHLWRCSGKIKNPKSRKYVRCGFKTSRHKGTWLDRTRLPPETIILLVHAFLQDVLSRAYARDNLGICSEGYADWCNYIREVCFQDVAASSTVVGGPGIVVEVDEMLLGRRKNNVDSLSMGKWVLGGFERGSRKVFLTIIPNRSASTLGRNIEKYILPGTTVVTDCWKGYASLGALQGYTHLTVKNLVDPGMSAHTVNIERELRQLKSSIPRNRRGDVDGYLAAYLWKRLHPDRSKRLHDFFVAVSRIYSPEPPYLSEESLPPFLPEEPKPPSLPEEPKPPSLPEEPKPPSLP